MTMPMPHLALMIAALAIIVYDLAMLFTHL